MWTYVAGVPLFPQVLRMTYPDAPDGWESSESTLRDRLPGLRIQHHTVRQYLLELPFMPLAPAMVAVAAYRKASPETRMLIELHVESLLNPGSMSGLVLTAKALELARALLPGNTDTQRQSALGATFGNLKQSLHWLYGRANQRLGIRHVVKKSEATPTLHQPLTPDERADFLHDADLVLRGTVGRQLQIEVNTVKRN